MLYNHVCFHFQGWHSKKSSYVTVTLASGLITFNNSQLDGNVPGGRSSSPSASYFVISMNLAHLDVNATSLPANCLLYDKVNKKIFVLKQNGTYFFHYNQHFVSVLALLVRLSVQWLIPEVGSEFTKEQ